MSVDFEVRNVLGIRFELGIPTDSHVVVPPMGLFFLLCQPQHQHLGHANRSKLSRTHLSSVAELI